MYIQNGHQREKSIIKILKAITIFYTTYAYHDRSHIIRNSLLELIESKLLKMVHKLIILG